MCVLFFPKSKELLLGTWENNISLEPTHINRNCFTVFATSEKYLVCF